MRRSEKGQGCLMTDIVERLRSLRYLRIPCVSEDAEEAAAEIERLRSGAAEGCETVQDGGVVPTVTWFDQKIAEECRIAQAEIARLREAIRRLADQDATLSVQDGSVTVTMDYTLTDATCPHVRGTVTQHCSLNFTLTDEEREAIEAAIAYLQPVGNYDSRVQTTLRSLLARLAVK